MAQITAGYDLAIIGSGSAAFAAAIAARTKGKTVVMVERGVIGGTCVNVGCVPSKALLAAAEARHGAHAASRFPGITANSAEVDFPALIEGKNALVRQLQSDKYTHLARDYGWQIVPGTASFTTGPTLHVTGTEGGKDLHLEATHFLIATGTAPWVPPVPGLEAAGYLTSTTAMDLTALPYSMVVVGGNAVGLEQAQLFARLGAKVTIVEALDRLAPFEEPEVSAAIEAAFNDEGITVHTSTTLSAVSHGGQGYTCTAVRSGQSIELQAQALLIATGRRPVTTGLGLEQVGVQTGPLGEIVVDAHLRTSNEQIWAAGDVTGGPQFVYVAAAQGTLVTDNALSHEQRTLDYTAMPRVIFTNPAIASVGLTEAQVIAAGGSECDCRTVPLTYASRPLVNRDTRGLIKLVADATTGKLLGVHVVAEGAGEVITAAAYAITAGFTIDQLAHTWAPYLTMSETLKLAAQAFTTDISKLSCCAG